MVESPNFDEFCEQLKASFELQLRIIKVVMQNPEVPHDIEFVDLHLARLLPDRFLETRPPDELDPDYQLYSRATMKMPFMAVVSHARRMIQAFSVAIDSEGQVEHDGEVVDFQGWYAEFQKRDPLPTIIRQLQVQTFPSYLPGSFEDIDDLTAYYEKYSEENDRLIEVLSCGLHE